MRIFFLLWGLLTAFMVAGQVKISGHVKNQNGKPVSGVSILLKGTYDGTTSDSLGNFSFETTEKGNQQLEASSTGYTTYNTIIQIENKNIINDILLKQSITDLEAVVITAGSFEASDKKKGTVLTSLDIVTTAGADGDITGALKTLPGTQQVGETGGLFVRGGTASESNIYMDGALVHNFFYSSTPGIASRGRFNPFLFKGTIFSTGGYSALYGQALSSALILESNDLPEKTEASFSAHIIGIGGGLQKLAKNKKSSYGFTYNFTHLGLAFAIIKQKQDYFQNPVYHEGDINFRIKTPKNGMVKYYGYFSTGKVGYRVADIDSANLKNALHLKNPNTYHNINWRQNLNNGWKLFTALSVSYNKTEFGQQLQNSANQQLIFQYPVGYEFKNFDINSTQMFTQARVVADKKLGGLSAFRFGADYFYSHEKSTFTLYNGSTCNGAIKDNLIANFAETDIYLSNKLALKIGLRAEHSALMDKWNLAPRVSLAYKLNHKDQLSFAYGDFYQKPEAEYLPAAQSIGYAKATHYILQYQKMTSFRTFRTELFYKNYDHLFKTGLNANGKPQVTGNNGNGYARGIEMFLRDKKTIKNADFWISYSYLDTERDFLNFPYRMAPNFAAKHSASLVLKKFITRLKVNFNMSYSFASGRPYYNIEFDAGQNKYMVTDKGQTINYNNLSLSFNYLPNIGKKDAKTFGVLVLSVNNILGQKQVFNYEYGTITGNKQAIGPTSKRFVFIGYFLSFGTDRTEDAINLNL